MSLKDLKLPKHVYLQAPTDYANFERELKQLAEKYVSPDWDWTFKLDGRVHKDIQKKDPNHHLLKTIQKELLEERNFSKNFSTPMKEDKKEEPARRVIFPQTERRAPPGSPPPPPPLVTPVDEKVGVDRVLLDALGKRAWQAEKLHEQEDRFFNTHALTFEGPELLPFRKELWEWCVKCVKGEKGDLFLALRRPTSGISLTWSVTSLIF